MDKTTGSRKEALSQAAGSVSIVPTSDMTIVPDNFGNYNLLVDADGKYVEDERKVIVDMDTFQLPGKANNTVYPLQGFTQISDNRCQIFQNPEAGGSRK